jgi:dUTP pyrophosphatase
MNRRYEFESKSSVFLACITQKRENVLADACGRYGWRVGVYTQLQVQLLRADACAPQRTRAGDAAYDLSCCEDFALAAGERAVIGTGIAVALPDDVCALLLPRSGLAARYGIGVVNSPGLIDPSYRGEINVILLNTSSEIFHAQAHDRIAQLLLLPFL